MNFIKNDGRMNKTYKDTDHNHSINTLPAFLIPLFSNSSGYSLNFDSSFNSQLNTKY